MHILYLHQYFTSHEGDYSTRSYEFAKRLMARGHHVTVVTSPAFLPSQYHLNKTQHIMIDGISTIIVPVPWSNSMGYIQRAWIISRFALLATWHAMRVQADVVLVSSPPITIALAGIAAKLRRRIPMVFEVRDLWPEVPIAIGALNNRLLRWSVEKFTQFTYSSSAHIIALSPSAADIIAARGFSKSKISMIPNCSDIDLFDVPPEEGVSIRERLQLKPGDQLLVYAGALGFTHGTEYLVDLAAHIEPLAPHARFLLVGKGKMREDIVAKAKLKGVHEHNFWVWDPMPKTEVPAILAAADAVLSTTIPNKIMEHNSANKFFDGLAARKPIAINYGGWQADLLLETGAGIVMKPGDPQQGAQQLAEFLADPERLQNASEAAFMLAQTRFDRERMAQKLEQVLVQTVQQQ